MIKTMLQKAENVEEIKTKKHIFSGLNLLIFIALLLIADILVFEIMAGALILAGTVLLLVALLNPKILYFVLISLFSLEGFAAFENVSYPKIVAALLMIGLTVRMALTKGSVPKDNSYKYLLLFLTGSIVSFPFAKEFYVSLQSYITYVALFVLYFLTRYFLKTERDIINVLNYLFISTLVTFAIVKITGLSVRQDMSSRVSSGIGDPNAFASYILVLIPLTLYRALHTSGILRITYWACVISFIILLAYSGSRGGILGFIGSVGVLVYYYGRGRPRQILLFVVILIFISYYFVPDEYWMRASSILHPETDQDRSISTRIDNYSASLRMFFDYPVAGVGLNNFQFNAGDYGLRKSLVVHNTFLEILSGGGLLSFIPFSLILINCWQKLKLKRKYEKTMCDLIICLKASFVSILITSSFISGDHKKILWFLLALIASVYYISNQRDARCRASGESNYC